MTGIDTAMPDVQNSWSDHSEWNQSDRFWRQDFEQTAACGFDLLRWQRPWSQVEPSEGAYRWDLIDPQVELATKLGIELFYPIVHFNYPNWIARPGEGHAVQSSRLAERLAIYTEKLLSRYHFRLVIPIVELSMDAFQRGWAGNWQPHLKGRAAYLKIWGNLLEAFRASADVAHSHNAQVFCSEPASELQTVLSIREWIDVAGIDLYPHLHRRKSIFGYLQEWSAIVGKPLCLSEFGTPETYDPQARKDYPGEFWEAGLDTRRVHQARILRQALEKAHRAGISIPYGGWYPGTGNIGWGFSLTKRRDEFDCDRAGLIDLQRQPDGTLRRVICQDLVREILGLREIYQAGSNAAQPVGQPRQMAAAAGSVSYRNSSAAASAFVRVPETPGDSANYEQQ